MAAVYKTPETYEQAAALLELGLLLMNVSHAEPRANLWREVNTTAHDYVPMQMREAYHYDRRSGPGWWVTDFAYILEE